VLKTCHVLGFPVHVFADSKPTGLANYVNWLQDRLQQAEGAQVITCNPEMIMLARREPEFASILHSAELVIPDGAGVVAALKLQGISVQRSPGIEIAETLISWAASQPVTLAFFGGKPAVSAQAAQIWRNRCPNLQLIAQHGYLSPEEMPAWLEQLQTVRPRLILVGLGSPRQEYWIQHHRHLLPQSIWIGVGGSFDIWAGVKQRAPYFWRASQLEWMYRLYQEPWRWQRMLVLPHFAWLVLRATLPFHHPHPDPHS
jgi:N-acetylglucosaminyldiphosphoundecaprenol N-acetyl-beta-D-mannosaminyltransferase